MVCFELIPQRKSHFQKIIDQIKQEKVEKVEFNDNKIIAYPKDGSNSLEAQLPVNTDF